MKRIRSSTFIKITAVFLFFIALISLTVSAVGVVFLIDSDAYFDGGANLENNVLDAAAYNYEVRLHQFADSLYFEGFYDEREFEDVFGEENCNYFFTLTDENGKVVLSNYTAKNTLRTYNKSDFWCYDMTEEWNGSEWVIYEQEHCLTLNDGIRAELSAKDRIYHYLTFTRLLTSNRYLLLVLVPCLLILCIALVVFLCCAAGHHPNTDTVMLNLVDRIPLEIFLAVLVGAEILLGVCLSNLLDGDIGIVGMLLAAIPFGLWLLLTVARRFKTQTLFTNTLIARLIKGIAWLFRQVAKISLYWQVGAVWVTLSLAELFVMIATDHDGYFPFWLIEKLILTPLIIWVVINMQTLRASGKELASGNVEHTVDTSHMLPVFREHGEHLNGIGDGLKLAVADSIKSERMRAELITNVSHDIKTPLTSIINYVDLLQKEGLDGEHAASYLEVIERQSARLKKLTEDLIEASKASSGAIKVELSTVDVNILLGQAVAEYDERLREAALTLMPRFDDAAGFIRADGRLLWRVFDNLLGNIRKYAKSDTRVYVTSETIGNHVSISFKNISAEPLDISPDELTERFVRGDRSRGTEGSGLGLSIAKSLTELQGGTFDIHIDGDLFKIVITFERSAL